MALGSLLAVITVPNVARGSHASMTPAALATAYGAGSIKTATVNFSISYRGHIVSFEKNVPRVVDAGLIAALTAAGAPVV